MRLLMVYVLLCSRMNVNKMFLLLSLVNTKCDSIVAKSINIIFYGNGLVEININRIVAVLHCFKLGGNINIFIVFVAILDNNLACGLA